jgi:hypothetical protein
MSHRHFLTRRAALAGLTGSALAGSPWLSSANAQTLSAVSGSGSPAVGGRPIEISARRIESFSKLSGESRFGRLQFRGGLVLTSTERHFGGLSGIAMEPDGQRFVAVSDEGHWLTGDLTYAGTAPTGLTNVRMGGIVAKSGRELGRKRDQDAEAVAFIDGTLARGTLLIAFERNHRIGRFPVLNRAVLPPIDYLRMPPEAKQMKSNKGFEAATIMAGGPHKGAVVAFSERFTDANGHHSGWLWIGGEPVRFQMTDVGEFDVTDVAGLPDGSLLVLQRRFRWTEGVKLQLRLLKPSEVAPGVIAEGTVLLTSDMTGEIDNMEGLSIHRDARGSTVVTMVSDDNFNAFLQRTILLQFALL